MMCFHIVASLLHFPLLFLLLFPPQFCHALVFSAVRSNLPFLNLSDQTSTRYSKCMVVPASETFKDAFRESFSKVIDSFSIRLPVPTPKRPLLVTSLSLFFIVLPIADCFSLRILPNSPPLTVSQSFFSPLQISLNSFTRSPP